MKRNNKTLQAKTPIIALTCLSLLVGNVTFAAGQTRAEYIREVVESNEIELIESPTDDVDNYVYTALQCGLVKGISFDFEGQITDEEREIILANVVAGLDQMQTDSSETENEEVEITKDDATEENSIEEKQEEAVIPSPQIERNYVTPYGTIKTPTQGLLEELWTDEEFHQYLIKDRGGYSGLIKAMYMYYEDVKESGVIYYYDRNLRKFFVQDSIIYWDENGETVYDFTYLEMDEEAHALLFRALKTAYFLAEKYDMKVSVANYSDRVRVHLKDPQTYSSSLALFIASESNQFSGAFNKIDGYDENVNKITMEWNILKLWDNDLYEEYGVELSDASTSERQMVWRESSFSQQKYADIFYAMCQSIHGEEADDIYFALMNEYMYENKLWLFDDIDTEKYEIIELQNHNIFIRNPLKYQSFYGIEIK